MHQGTALFTMGTREMDDKEEERAGLASKHAYAVLDVREECGRRIVKLKNPWFPPPPSPTTLLLGRSALPE